MAGTFTFPDDVPTLSDGEVTLRAHAPSDVDEMVVQCTDPVSIEWTTVPVPFGRADAEGFIENVMRGGWERGTEWGFAIEAPHPDGVRRFSGSASLRVMPDGVAEIAYGLHPAVRGRGVCSRAVKLLVDWGFAEQRLDVVLWLAQVGNWASRRVAWANGFSFDGKIGKFLNHRGVRHDAWAGSLRRDDTREPKHRWNVPPVLESARLRLRPDRLSDGERFVEMMTDERSAHFNGRSEWSRRRIGPEEAIMRNLEGDARGERFNWCIADRETDLMIGHIQLFDVGGFDDTSAEIGYVVHPDARGRGVLTEALGMLVECSFRSVADGGLGLRRLCLGTAGSNKASRYVAETVGFVHVATEPETFGTGAEGFEDRVTYHRLNPSWSAPLG